MADVILLESSVPFNAAEWIGVGKLYKDVPIEVSDACCDARTIPADLQATFTSRATPIRKSWRSGYHRLTGGDYGWERWQALASRAVYRIIDVPGFDGDSDDEDEEEEEYEEPEEGSGGKKRKPKPPRGAVKRKKTDGTKQSKSGANKAPSKRRKVANAAKTAEKGRALSSKVSGSVDLYRIRHRGNGLSTRTVAAQHGPAGKPTGVFGLGLDPRLLSQFGGEQQTSVVSGRIPPTVTYL
ncbi:hypothetical protein DFH08DRAFT_977964 [Mycena albidolilacea]|uniref:Uncharacterized protein n=1 Tax=Mycena albidolilacea TaxID=1033008 RepID=A0AAD7E8P0_9AGAR|nr:hypothetical protein DFH08DRAFT_977964 [Mycena albidolilacea]